MWKSHEICSISLLCHVPIFWACKCGSHMSSAQYCFCLVFRAGSLRGGAVWDTWTHHQRKSECRPVWLLVQFGAHMSLKDPEPCSCAMRLFPWGFFLFPATPTYKPSRVRCGSHMSSAQYCGCALCQFVIATLSSAKLFARKNDTHEHISKWNKKSHENTPKGKQNWKWFLCDFHRFSD